MSAPRIEADQWLSAALNGGLPEPTLSRWQPLRVGIVSLWEYDDAEFWFADGRLVLRGGNGAGKTKVLELTTLMLLRGEITAATLDPFGSQHRTMRFNLLPTGEEDDPRPHADAGLGYAWVEFGRRDDDGRAHYFVCGLGASTRRGSGTSPVTPWQLITQLRPGRDFQLSSVDRPLDMAELKKIDGVQVLQNATRYRSRLATELFGLSADAYDNLTELLKQLRKPKLGERLNPTILAETLRDALPPLASNEIDQLADGWDRLERLREAVDETKDAALRVARFVQTGWLPWARIVVRRRADAYASATTKLDDTTKARRVAESGLQVATATVTRLGGELTASKQHQVDLTTELRELLDGQAFQDARAAAARVDSITERLGTLRGQHSSAEDRSAGFETAVAKAAGAVADAEKKVESGQNAATERWQQVENEAAPAGLADSVRRHRPTAEVLALRADLDVRTERFARLRELDRSFTDAKAKADGSAQDVEHRSNAVTEATKKEAASHHAVQSTVDTLRTEIREWAAGTSVFRCTAEQVENWCDLVAELTADDSDTETPSTAIGGQVEIVREELRGRREELRGARRPLATESEQLTARLAELENEAERPPPPPVLWRRRARPPLEDAAGAPLWRCARPVDGVSTDELTMVETTMAAAGLLDAWLTPDGRLSTVDGMEPVEVQLLAPGGGGGATLASVLAPESAGGVPAEVIRSVLAGIGWHQDRPTADGMNAWLAADGTWRLGPLTGRVESVRPASYLGAAAREAARQREIHQITERLTELAAEIAELDEELQDSDDQLSTLAAEARRIPSERPITKEVARWRERQQRVLECQEQLTKSEVTHQRNESARDTAWSEFAQYASHHAFPLRRLDTVESALHAYRLALGALGSAIVLLRVHADALTAAADALATQQGLLGRAATEVADLAGRIRQAEVKLRTATQALSSGHQELLARRDTLDEEIGEHAKLIDDLGGKLRAAEVAAVTAESTLETHEGRRQDAEEARDSALTAWWEVFDAGVAQPTGLEEPDRRNVTSARDLTTSARREITVGADEQAQDRGWRRCYQQLEDLRQHLLPNRDARVVDELDGGTIQRVVVLADSTTGWQAPHQAADALADRVREQENNFDAEQQRVLTTLLGSTFIEHLKERLDYTERTFININKQLAQHPTRHGHAVRLGWAADPTDPDASAVVNALGQGYQQLSAERQEMVRSFLARKIDAARADASTDGVADWKDQLSSALDYRSWLKLSLQYRAGSTSKWTSFDSAKHGAKSGGEKVVLLSQPLFAAAVVAYNAAADTAPRWVWLDEAMTGVDGEIKASFMGLTVNFDLDVMLTAHDEWCKYSTVPAVAVYDLARQKGLPGVDAMPYLWCGGEWTQFDPLSLDRSGTDRLAAEGLFADFD